MRPRRFSPALFVVKVMKFFGWFTIACGIFMVLAILASGSSINIMAVLAPVTAVAATSAGFFWLAYALIFLRKIAHNSSRQARYLRTLAHPVQRSSTIPDLAPTSTNIDLAPPKPFDPTGLPAGFIITGLDKNGLKFHLTYQWLTRDAALERAKSDGLIEILDVMPIKK